MNFAIIYITMGFPRLSTELKTQLTPELLVALAGKPDVHQDKILSLIVPLLGDIKLSEDSEAKKRILRLLEQNSVKMQLISYLQDVLLFPYGVTQESEMPAGMSAYTFRRISGNQWRTEELERYKTGLVKFLSSDLLKPEDVVVPLIVASADTRFSVATPAIAELSKICISIDWTDGSLSAPLYSLFSGNGVKIPDKKSSPCNVRVRQKLLQYLLKCRGSGIDTIKGIQVIFEALFGEQTNQRCKVLALQFSENLIKDGNPELIRKVSKVIATGIGKVVNASPPEPIDVQNAAYSAMSILVCVCPEIVRKDLQLVVTYFTTLDKAQSEIQASLREALISMAPAFSWSHETTTDTSDQGNHNLLLALIAQHSESQSTIVQSVCVVFLTTCFPPQQVTARYLLLLIAAKALSDSHPMIISASVRGLSFIGCVTELPIVDMGSDDSKESLLGILMGILKSNSVKQKLREEVCTCLSNLSHGDPKFFSQKILQEFLKLNKLTKDPALHIAIGQAIGSILGRQSVDVFQQDGDMKMDTDTCEDEELLKWLLKELYSLVKELHPSSRQALAIWLLATVKAGSRGNTVQENREILQMIFTELLSENNELVQDVASRGLGVIFSLSNKMDQKDLANELLLQLTGGQRKMMQVTGESKIFEEGVLGKTPTGENITTYRELCSLASDLNKPDLIYQFMQLANHNATWNSKLGAAFGLKSIAGLAKEDMEPFLGKIVPRLFRYKYDPTPKIQNSMVSIWNSLVSNPKEIVEQFYWEILQENTDTETELVELWNQLFRVMDDIHEGTRLAAEGTATVLSKSCIVACSPGHGKSGIRVVKSILPLFLEKGITNVVPEVRKISIRTLSDIIDSAGDSIAPHLVLLIPCLLQATGEVEIEKLSYMSTRFGDQSEVQEVVDTMRAEVAKQHHTMVAIGKCIRFITTDILEKVTPGIVDLIKTSVNLGTKVACAHFICQISVRLGKDMTPISSKYLSACYYGVSDRNPTVRKYFASAIGHLSGILRESSLVKLFTKLTDFYNDRQSYKCQAVPAILQSINKRYPDTLKDYGGQALPLIFFAMHDETDQAASEVWKDLWNDVSPGESGIRMHLDNIMPNLLKFLEDSSWTLKSQSGNAIKTLAKQLGKSLGGAEREILIKALVTALAGRTFQGKEKLLNALENLCEHLESTTGELETLVVDAVMRECRKEEPIYRTHSLKALGNILDALKIDRFEEVYNMVWNILEHTSIIGDEDTVGGVVSAEERNKALQVNIALKESVCEILGKAWPVNSAETQQKYQVMFAQKCVECLNRNTRPVQVSLLAALGRFVERLKILESPTVSVESPMECDKAVKKAKVESNAETTETICKIVLRCIGQVAEIPHTGLKKESLNILLIMINRLKKINDTIVLLMIKEHFAGTIDFFRRDNSPEIKCRVKDIEEKLRDV
uniref:Proteasome-associated protein ecm29 n=1 Tax=Lutzomyia longipalpis TaxID=7200 RepID=A0A1B0CSE0_LUTLO